MGSLAPESPPVAAFAARLPASRATLMQRWSPPKNGQRYTEPATGHDSPTSILCLQCSSRVSFFAAAARIAGHAPGKVPRSMLRSPLAMGLSDHRDALKAAELRVESIKVSL